MRVERGENFVYLQIIPHYIEFRSKLIQSYWLMMFFKLLQGLVSIRLLISHSIIERINPLPVTVTNHCL